MKKIVLVGDSSSFIMMTLVQQLEELGETVVQAEYDSAELDNIGQDADAFFLNIPEDSKEDEDNLLSYFKNRVIKDDIALMLLGNNDQFQAIQTVVPKRYIKKYSLRPINVREAAGEIHDYLQQDKNQQKKEILVVDDSGSVLRTVKGWLEGKYQVLLANSGTSAIKYLTLKHPDLVLLDYEMPICDGKQVFEMIRSDPEFSDIPIFFLTGRNDQKAVLNLSALKPDGYLLKTQEPKQILKTIDDFFAKHA